MNIIQKRTPHRIPYVRAAYFSKDKLFLNTFWEHLKQKPPADQERRLKLYIASMESAKNGQYFSVQIKENKADTS